MDLNIIIEKAISNFEDESLIVEKSTPVISFGDFRGARVLTLGINPSHREFLDSNKKLLSGKLKRLEDFESLNLSDRSDLNFRHGKLIFEACCNYFKGNNSYRWFSELEPILKIFNSSYSDGTAAHLDLVQSATEKIWSQS